MEYKVEYIRKKHSSAVIRDGVCILRISSRLSVREQERHIQALLERMEKKMEQGRGTKPLFEPLLTTSSLEFFNGKTFTFALMGAKRGGFERVGNQILCKTTLLRVGESMYIHDAIEQEICSIKDVKSLVRRFAMKYLKPEVEAIVREWHSYMDVRKDISKVSISNMETRWGSCSSTGNINIALKTLLLPSEIFESVCVHEVAHLEQMNHSKKFWDIVLSVMPQYHELKKELRNYN